MAYAKISYIGHQSLQTAEYSSYIVKLNQREHIMLSWALLFFVIALVAAALGFGALAGTAASIAQLLFVGFLILTVVVLLTGRGRGMLT